MSLTKTHINDFVLRPPTLAPTQTQIATMKITINEDNEMWHPFQAINSTDDFEPERYSVSTSVERYHNSWRFGHSNNFTKFVYDVMGEGDEDYIAGQVS